MSDTVDARQDRDAAVERAADALRAGELVVLPTDTVYGIAADAFRPKATNRIFTAKLRSRTFPLPVLIRSQKQLPGIVAEVPEACDRLVARYWPGPLTIVLREAEDLVWDLGHSQGTVAVRMPLDDVCLAIIREVGPLAVTSANLSGQAPATTAAQATGMLGAGVAVYVDDGPRDDARPSTIVDLTRSEPYLIRDGELPPDEVMRVARGEEA